MPRHMTVRTQSRRAQTHGLLTPWARFRWVMALVVLAPLAYGCYVARTPTSQLFGDIYTHGPRTEKVVALTFDDGPNDPYTGQILDALKQEGVHATFFCVGINAEREPATVRRIAAEGNEVGNHSYRHQKRDTLLDLHYNDAVRTNDDSPWYHRHTAAPLSRTERISYAVVAARGGGAWPSGDRLGCRIE